MPLVVRGPDVSAVQGYPGGKLMPPDWSRVADAGYGFGICKVIEGNADTPDPSFAYNWPRIAGAGLVRGCYPFVHPDTIHAADAEDEAKRCVAQIRRFGGFRPGLDFIMGDLEDRYTREHGLLDGEPFVRWMVTWGETVEEESGATPAAYTGGPYFASHLGGRTISPELLQRLARFPLVIAAYVTDPEKYVAMTPWRARGWFLWQRSGDVGAGDAPGARIPGIAVVTDENVFRGTPETLRAFVRSLRVAPTVEQGLQLGDASAVTSIADEVHSLQSLADSQEPDTIPDTQAAKTRSSDRIRAMVADDTWDGGDKP